MKKKKHNERKIKELTQLTDYIPVFPDDDFSEQMDI